MSEKNLEHALQTLRERFGQDSLIALATVENGLPHVRTVNAYYEGGSFYVVTHAKSGKMRQIGQNPAVAVCGDWFTGHGAGENLGYVCAEQNAALAEKLRKVFAAWYTNGHVDESDPGTCILRIRLADGLLADRGNWYPLDFTALSL